MCLIDRIVAACLPALAVWLVFSGLDDLFVDFLGLLSVLRRRKGAEHDGVGGAPASEPPIAIFLPLWHEDRVIASMLEHNLAAIRYGNYCVFAGGYPNDRPTLEAIQEVQRRFPNVRLALCPHGGPTSKADCLNWIYQRMLDYERRHGTRFVIVVVHDAEDVVDPGELSVMARYARKYGMVQVPVLPLPTPLGKLTHGVYCDEFAEYHTKDMPARGLVGAFIPSSGVGTGYARRALERLAETGGGRLFDPACLTEDYDIGLRLHRLGFAQVFVPLRFEQGRPAATREYFPQHPGPALRQRRRWLTGNALQAWERHGWSGGPRQAYWFWRDRKGLVGNPVSAAANLILVYGVLTWLWSRYAGTAWGLGAMADSGPLRALFGATLLLQLHRLVVRVLCVGRIYGWVFAAGAPVRVIWANWINFLATVGAVAGYVQARLRRRPLAWLKTEHVYPSRQALAGHQRLLGELLLRAGHLDEARLRQAVAAKPAQMRLGEYLVAAGDLSEEQVYEALSLQQSIPFKPLNEARIPRWTARALPGSVARRWQIVPFEVSRGRLYVAGPELPEDEAQRELSRCTRLEVRFQYITPGNYERLVERLLGTAGQAAQRNVGR
ncbi:MAG: glycosyl transferase family protein [Bryobacteraceae bacterium]